MNYEELRNALRDTGVLRRATLIVEPDEPWPIQPDGEFVGERLEAIRDRLREVECAYVGEVDGVAQPYDDACARGWQVTLENGRLEMDVETWRGDGFRDIEDCAKYWRGNLQWLCDVLGHEVGTLRIRFMVAVSVAAEVVH